MRLCDRFRRIVDAVLVGCAKLALLADALALIIVHCHAHRAAHGSAQIGLIIAHGVGADLIQDAPNFGGILVAGFDGHQRFAGADLLLVAVRLIFGDAAEIDQRRRDAADHRAGHDAGQRRAERAEGDEWPDAGDQQRRQADQPAPDRANRRALAG